MLDAPHILNELDVEKFEFTFMVLWDAESCPVEVHPPFIFKTPSFAKKSVAFPWLTAALKVQIPFPRFLSVAEDIFTVPYPLNITSLKSFVP